MKIEPTSKVNGNLFDILGDEYALDAMIIPKEDTPCPWDADITFDGNKGKVILVGGITPGGGRDGTCRVEVSMDSFSDYYTLEIPVSAAEVAESAGFLVED